MPPLKFKEVLSFSSEDPNHPAENLLRPDTFRKWKCAPGSSEKQAFVILKLERLSSILSVDVGNEGSAFVEVLVAREGGDFQVLLVASSFMTPTESRNESNLSRVRMFASDKLNKTVAENKWDRIKVICTQPFNKNMQYGLSFITVTVPSEGSSDSTPKNIKIGKFTLKDEEENDPIAVGSMFARRRDSDVSSPLTGAAAIRAASSSAATAASSSPTSEEAKKKKPSNAPEMGFYQLKKNPSSDTDVKKTPKPSKPAEASTAESTPKRKHSDKDRERDKEKRRRDEDNRKEKDKNQEKDKHKKDKYQEKNKRPESDKKKEEMEGDKKKEMEGSKRKKEEGHQTASSSTVSSSKKKSAPFTSLLNGVNFVLSGYQNPERSQIRDMMIDMGAQYKPDWGTSCTHLVCAFANTPKHQQVKGKGRIVTAKWVFDCHKNKIRYPCKRYSLDKQERSAEDSEEEEIWAEEILPKEERSVSKPAKKSTAKPTAASDVEDGRGYSSGDTYSDNENTDDEIERVLAKRKIKEENTTADKKIKGENATADKKLKEENVAVDKTTTSTKNSSTDKPANKKIKVEKKEEKPKESATNSSRKSSKAEVKEDMNGTEDNIYDDDTDIDEDNQVHMTRPDTSSLPLPSLGDYLRGKHLFLYGSMSADMKQLLSRYIIAFDGTLEDYMNKKVNFVVTEDEWDDNFDDALSDNSSLQFVKPTWIWRCSDRQKMVPFQPFMVVPKE